MRLFDFCIHIACNLILVCRIDNYMQWWHHDLNKLKGIECDGVCQNGKESCRPSISILNVEKSKTLLIVSSPGPAGMF